MPTIFPSRPGQVAMLAGGVDGDLGLPLAVDGIAGSWFPDFQSILTGLQFALDGNFQIAHTCANVAHVYAFGDRVTQLVVAGAAFSDACPAGAQTGIERVLAWYDQNRVAARSTPVQVQIGATAAGRFRGVLAGLRGTLDRPEQRISQFSLLFTNFPGR